MKLAKHAVKSRLGLAQLHGLGLLDLRSKSQRMDWARAQPDLLSQQIAQ